MHFLTQVPVDFINNANSIQAGFIIFGATALGWVLLLSVIMFLLFRRIPYSSAFAPFEKAFKRIGDIFVLLITAFASYIFSVVFKNIFTIGRPAMYDLNLHPLLSLTGYGFPSSHAAFYGAVAFILYYMDTVAGIFAFLVVLVIGTSRVLAGVHSPLDILGGLVLGLLTASVVDFIVEKLNNWRVR